MSEFSLDEVIARKVARISTIVNHRTDYGTFEDEESELFLWLLKERAEANAKLQEAEEQIKRLSEILLKGEDTQ